MPKCCGAGILPAGRGLQRGKVRRGHCSYHCWPEQALDATQEAVEIRRQLAHLAFAAAAGQFQVPYDATKMMSDNFSAGRDRNGD